MMMYDMTTQYQAGRVKTAAEQRGADEQIGMMAARAASVWQCVTRPAQALRGSWARRVRTSLYAR